MIDHSINFCFWINFYYYSTRMSFQLLLYIFSFFYFLFFCCSITEQCMFVFGLENWFGSKQSFFMLLFISNFLLLLFFLGLKLKRKKALECLLIEKRTREKNWFRNYWNYSNQMAVGEYFLQNKKKKFMEIPSAKWWKKLWSSGSLIRILKSIQMEIEIRQQMKEYN